MEPSGELQVVIVATLVAVEIIRFFRESNYQKWKRQDAAAQRAEIQRLAEKEEEVNRKLETTLRLVEHSLAGTIRREEGR